MRQEIITENKVDVDGNPAGGTSRAIGIDIRWQHGPIPRDKDGNPMQSANGAFVEGVIQAAIDRLEFYQSSKFKCRENSLMITKLEEALHWGDHRTYARIKKGVEGTHTV